MTVDSQPGFDVAALDDWIGDRLPGLGHLLARWTEPGEEPAIGVWDIEIRDGLPSRACPRWWTPRCRSTARSATP